MTMISQLLLYITQCLFCVDSNFVDLAGKLRLKRNLPLFGTVSLLNLIKICYFEDSEANS